ncbi:MAG: alpha/beta fold hydrolase [Deltaproteobacteria bacterium]|nr:alpha/beta fold hydrolase [Deltaproteobacteria bacterium]
MARCPTPHPSRRRPVPRSPCPFSPCVQLRVVAEAMPLMAGNANGEVAPAREAHDADCLDLRDVNLVCHDWGGIIGLRLVAEQPQRFASVVAANIGMPTGQTPVSEDLRKWPEIARQMPEFPIGRMVSMGCTGGLTDAEIAAYDAPFPDETYKAAARSFPALIPITPDNAAVPDQLRAWETLDRFDRPLRCAFSDMDPFDKGGNRALEKRVPGAQGQTHTAITGGGHFLQEDRGAELAQVVVAFLGRVHGGAQRG